MVQYVRICSAGTLFIVAFNVIGSVFRGLGDSKMPLITVAIACVTNIFGDLLLVDIFKMGAFGVRIPVSFAMSRLPNVRLFYIGLATPCSTVVQVLLCLGYYAHLARRERTAR